MEVIVSALPQEAAGQTVTEALRVHGSQSILLLVSGGSALTLLDFIDPTTLGPRVTLSVLDERFSTDDTVNNFALLEQTHFFTQAVSAGVNFFSTKVAEGDSLATVRERFDTALHAWRTAHPNGVVIVTMGVGSDGHTAGIFAGENGVDWSTEEWTAAYSVPASVNPHTERITVTDTFFATQVQEAVMYAVGAEKQTLVMQLQSPVCNRTILPACVIHRIPTVTLVTAVIG